GRKGARRMGREPLAAMVLVAVLVGPSAGAQPVDAPSSSVANGPQVDKNIERPWWVRDEFDRSRFMTETSSHYLLAPISQNERSVLFFPPVPPPLGSDIPGLPPFTSGKPAPPGLAPFVNELFYPMLAARLAADDLPKALRAELQTYLSAKKELQNELRSRIEALRDSDPRAREQQLEAFAALQAPRIVDARAAAERLRTDLRRTGVFGLPAGGDGGNLAGGRLPASIDSSSGPTDLRLKSEAMRAAAFYQDGLSTTQRHLLREAAIELEAEDVLARSAAQAGPEGRLLYFSPAPARISIPSNLPASLEKKISEYLSEKARLKAELLEAIRNNDDSGNGRTEAFKRLAATEAPPISDLEVMAEGIRRDLGALPDPGGSPTAATLPPELTARISAYRRHKVELLKTLRGMLTAPVRATDAVPIRGDARTIDPFRSAMEWTHNGTTSTELPASDLNVSVAEFDRVQRTLIEELNREQAGIREALSEYVRASNRPSDRKSINDLLKDFEDARQRQEVRDKYRDYQAAVLMPGLSAEQRRLLFDAAVEELALPLPPGESAR
ncbi:MAG TPA: hypothetical protein VMR25_09665, partial [Planctomycetaceae bacterium]|nr:hypothetical protein [Planctomycetaceae bacterium]